MLGLAILWGTWRYSRKTIFKSALRNALAQALLAYVGLFYWAYPPASTGAKE